MKSFILQITVELNHNMLGKLIREEKREEKEGKKVLEISN